MRRRQQQLCTYRNSFDFVSKEARQGSCSSNDGKSDSDGDEKLIRYGMCSCRHAYLSNALSEPKVVIPYSALHHPGRDGEFESLCFFFTNYVNVPRESHTNLFLEAILPLYNSVSSDSPLRHATSAVAVAVADFWRTLGPYSGNSRKSWAKAVAATRNAIFDPQLAQSDELLAAIFMLDFYEGLNRRYVNMLEDPDLHQKAAIAIIQARGPENLSTDVSRRLFSALRSKYIFGHLQSRKAVDVNDELLTSQPAELSEFPTSRLDRVMVDLSNLLSDLAEYSKQAMSFDALRLDSDGFTDTTPAEALLQQCFQINRVMNEWRETVPDSWQPFRITDPEEIHYSIRAVGLYNGLCDVYSSHTVAQMMNFWRTMKITTLRLIKHLSWLVGVQFMLEHVPTDAEVDEEIQTLADEICACVPFHLGSRTTVSYPHEPQKYPPVPGWLRESAEYIDSMGRPTMLTDADHARTAASAGGWFLLTPLTTIMEYHRPFPLTLGADERSTLEPVTLRQGQLRWITAQCRRIHKIYLIPWPYGPVQARGSGGSISLSSSWGPRDSETRVS